MKMGLEMFWWYAGRHLTAKRESAEWVDGVLVGSDSRRSCGYSSGREHISAGIDDIEDGRGDALVLRWPAFGCSRGGVRSGWAACSWRRIRGVVVVFFR